MNYFKRLPLFPALVMCILSVSILHQPLQADNDEPLSAVKTMIGLIRYNRDDRALEYIDLDGMTRYLLGNSYDQASAEQKQRFTELLGEYISLSAFPKAREYFNDVDLSYDAPGEVDDRVHIRSAILYSGNEQLTFTWVMADTDDGYRVIDFLDAEGNSQMQTNKEKAVQPLLQQKGIPGVIAALETAVNRLK